MIKNQHPQYINRSVCEFYMIFIILRMAIKKESRKLIPKIMFYKHDQNQVLEMFISMKIDAE